MSNMILKENVFQWLRAMKPQIVHIENCFEALSNFSIDAYVVNKNSGINKIRLALSLAASQTRQEAVPLH